MGRSRFTEERIIEFLRPVEAAIAAAAICRQGGFSNARYYTWRGKFAYLVASELKRRRWLEAGNAMLKLCSPNQISSTHTTSVVADNGKRSDR